MLGAIIGDIAGSRFEWQSHKSKQFDLLNYEKGCRFTDDSVMSLAVAKAILDCNKDYSKLSAAAIENMRYFGNKYYNAGYGGMFFDWLFYTNDPQPYNSYGNGAAMRVSACGFAASSLEEAKLLSHEVTKVTHNHPEGLKGAEATAVAVYLAKSGMSIQEIQSYINSNYYNIDFKLDGIRKKYEFDVTCQGSVPQALEAFFESTSFEDAIRNAVSIGGDSDTIAAITGGIAEAYYGIPSDIRDKALTFLDDYQKSVIDKFEKEYPIKI